MIETMIEYETIYFTKPDLDVAALNELGEKIQGVCTREGHLLNFKDWGVRKLTYEVNKQRKGHYFYVNFLGNNRMVPELERNLRYNEGVLRFQTVKVGFTPDVEARKELAKRQGATHQPPAEVTAYRQRPPQPAHDDGDDISGDVTFEAPTGGQH